MLGLGNVRHRELIPVDRRAPFFFRDENISGRQVDSYGERGSRKKDLNFALAEVSLDEITLLPAQIRVVDRYAF